MPTNLKMLPRLLSFAAAALVLFAAVNADAQERKTSSAVIPPIRSGLARIWIYAGPSPATGFEYPTMQAVTLNGANVGYETLGSTFYRDVPPGHYVIAAPSFTNDLDASQKAKVDLAAGQQAYLKLDSIWWPNGGGENMVPEFYVRLMPPQTGYTSVAQLAFLGGN